MSAAAPRTYQRFTLARRIEHLVMMLSFTALALTGLPQKFPDSSLSAGFVSVVGGIENVRQIHHFAAVVMMLGTAWHLIVFGYLAYVRRTRMTMLPTTQDLKDGWHALLYNVGLARSYPQMSRYTFEEKMEYWAFVWGAIIMGVTGFMMWNPVTIVRFLPGEVIPAAKAAHGGEALLAVLAIIIWHMYGVHIRRLNKSMWTGEMSEEEMFHEHPLELADVKAGTAERDVDPVMLRRRQRAYIPVAAILTLFMLVGVYGFVNAEQTAITTTERQVPTVEVFVPQTRTPAPTQTPTMLPTHTPLPSPTRSDSESTPQGVADAPTWNGEIASLLKGKCGTCHEAGALGGLNLATYQDAMAGGASGPAVIPGDAARSLLVIVQQEGGHPGQLSPEEIARIIEWIESGAPEN